MGLYAVPYRETGVSTQEVRSGTQQLAQKELHLVVSVRRTLARFAAVASWVTTLSFARDPSVSRHRTGNPDDGTIIPRMVILAKCFRGQSVLTSPCGGPSHYWG